MSSGSLRVRLLIAGLVAVGLALTIAGAGLGVLFERHVERRVLDELSTDLDVLIGAVDLASDGALGIVNPPTDPRLELPYSGYYWQVEAEGEVFRSRSLWDEVLALPDRTADGALQSYRIDGPAGAELLAAERSVQLPARLGGGTARLVMAVDRAEIAAATAAFRADMVPYLVLLGFFLLSASFAQVTIGLRPLRAVQDKLAEVKAGTARRLGNGYPSEVRSLANEVDSLLDVSDRSVARARARASDLAHALKTPLQVLAGDVERLKEKGETKLADDIGSIATTMRRVVDRELLRARIAPDGARDATNVLGAVEQVLSVVKRSPDGERLDWRVEIDRSLAVRLGRDGLAEALGNLVENAARYAAGTVVISASPSDGTVAIAVRDDGKGIDPARLAEVTRRGVRLDQGGAGAGLGLAIVADIAEAAGGTLAIANVSPGLEAAITLPAAPTSDAVS